MNKKALYTLEYNKIIEQLEALADSSSGKESCRNTVPYDDLSVINHACEETSDALSRIYRHGAPSFSGAVDIRASFLRLEVGSVLGIEELLQVSSLLGCSESVKAYNKDITDSLTDMFL